MPKRYKGDGLGRQGGKPKGYKFPKTLAKEAARELVRQKITERLDKLIDGAIANAEGLSFLVVRDKLTGKFLRVGRTGARGATERLAKNEVIIEVWEKDPSIQALTELLNRALDRPMDRLEADVTVGDWQKLAARLAAARNRK